MDIEALNMRTGVFERDMSYLTRCTCPDGDVDAFDKAAFYERVEEIRKNIKGGLG